jgi:hypothetical protein
LLDGLAATNGSIIYGNGSNLANSSVGNSGQILMSNGAGTPTWIDASTSGIGTTYAAGVGLSLSSNNQFSVDYDSTLGLNGNKIGINLGSTNTWTGDQTFGNLTIGGTFVSVGSTNLVTNLNADLLDGYHASSFVSIGSTGSFIYTASNGVGLSGSDFQLGGTLTKNTEIFFTKYFFHLIF